MIMDFNVSYKDYTENILNNYEGFTYTCPVCAAKGRFYRHGFYVRWLSILKEKLVTFISLKILRLKCLSCGKTHGILPSGVIPFQIYSLANILTLLTEFFLKQVSLRKIAVQRECDVNTLSRKIILFKKILPLLDLCLRQLLYYDLPATLLPIQALTFLNKQVPEEFDYFYCHGHPLFLNRRNTKSYPLVFSAAVTSFSDST